MKSSNWDDAGIAPFESDASTATLERPAAPVPPPDDDEGHGFDFLSVLKPLGNAPAWVISLGVHALILMILSTFVSHEDIEALTSIVSSIEDVEPELDFDSVVVDQVGTNGDMQTLSAAQSLATSQGQNPQEVVQREIEEQVLPPTITISEDVAMPAEDELVASVDLKGSSNTASTGGVEGSIDRLAYELAGSLKERKTLVVWLFDRSLSLKERRDSIADRFENVYKQLEALEPDADKALKTAVATYGEKTTILTSEPVDDVRPLVKPIRDIPNDESGKENVFAAVDEVARRWQSYRTQSRRNMLIFIVTDERGDDFDKMENVIQFVRRSGIRCYVVGNAAPFGKEKGYVRWKYADNFEEDIEVDQGPETVRPESLRLGFWGTNGSDLDRMSSSYGPYALTRLCSETGGMYLIADHDPGAKRFDHELMRSYSPDYRPIRDYDTALKKNKAKAALVAAATTTSATYIPIPQLGFRADTDTALRTEITEAQKPAADLDNTISKMADLLAEGEKDREKINEPRWQAAYDVAYGRVLAIRARAFGYNTVLAEMKATPKAFTGKGNNHWRLVPSKEITAGPNVKKLAVKAATLLKRVVDDHPGTPWAMMAERELSQPMGWEWKEDKQNYPGMGMNEQERNLLLLAEEEEKKKKEMEKKNPPRVKPKL